MQFLLQTASTKLVQDFRREKSRWLTELALLENDKDLVVGNSLLSASFLTYVGNFSSTYRNEMVNIDWLLDIRTRKIPIDAEFNILSQQILKSYVLHLISLFDKSELKFFLYFLFSLK